MKVNTRWRKNKGSCMASFSLHAYYKYQYNTLVINTLHKLLHYNNNSLKGVKSEYFSTTLTMINIKIKLQNKKTLAYPRNKAEENGRQ